MSTPMKPEEATSTKVLSTSTNGDKLFASIEAKIVKEAEEEVRQMAAKHLQKRSSEIMISSDTDDADSEQFSFIKWLSPKTAKEVKHQLTNIKISESPAKKNLKLN